jgi:hypothetical protein
LPNGPNNRIASDLVPGIGAAIAFLLMCALHISVLIGAALGIATYVGLRFLMPPPRVEPAEIDPLVAAKQSVARLRESLVTPPIVQAKLNDVCKKATDLIAYLESDDSDNGDGKIMVQQYLSLLQGAVSRYSDAVKLSGGIGQESTKSIVELLDGLATRFESLKLKLAHEDDAEISGEIKALNQTLTEMDTLTLKVRGDSS